MYIELETNLSIGDVIEVSHHKNIPDGLYIVDLVSLYSSNKSFSPENISYFLAELNGCHRDWEITEAEVKDGISKNDIQLFDLPSSQYEVTFMNDDLKVEDIDIIRIPDDVNPITVDYLQHRVEPGYKTFNQQKDGKYIAIPYNFTIKSWKKVE